MQKIIIQKVSENMADATVGTWFIGEGDHVAAGDPVVELITEKATFEIESEQTGVLLKQFASSKSVLPVGFTVAVIGEQDEEIPAHIQETNRSLLRNPEFSLGDSPPPHDLHSSSSRVKATPAARRKAQQYNIRLEDIRDFPGSDKVISEKDVERYASESEKHE